MILNRNEFLLYMGENLWVGEKSRQAAMQSLSRNTLVAKKVGRGGVDRKKGAGVG